MPGITCYNSDGTPLSYLTQWDKNITLSICDVEDLSTPFYFHFSNSNSGTAIPVEPDIEDGKVSAQIPNVLLEANLPITVHLYYVDEDGPCRTKYTIIINVISRVEPEDQ